MGCAGSSPAAVVETAKSGGDGASVPVNQSALCSQDYTFGKELGSGAYSTVLLGKHKVIFLDSCTRAYRSLSLVLL